MSDQPTRDGVLHQDGVLHRDGITWLVYTAFVAFGWFLYAFTPSVDLLRGDEHVSDALAALHGTGYAVGIILLSSSAHRILRVTGRGRGFWIFCGVVVLGIAIYLSAPVLPLTVFAAFIMGAGGAGLLSTASAALANHHGPAGAAAITEANAIAAGFGLIAPLAVAGGVHAGIGWRPALAVPVVVLALLFLMRGRFGPGLDATSADVTAGTDDETDLRLGRTYWLTWGFLVLCTGIEFCLTLWSGQFLHERTGLGEGTAATGVTAVVGGLAIGRVVGVRLSRWFSLDALLAGALVTNLIGFVIFWAARVPWAGYVGLFICGLGIALQYPLAMARAINSVSGTARANRAASWLTLGTGIAIGAAPFLVGYLADAVTITWAFLLVPGLIVAGGVMLVLAHRTPATVPLPVEVPAGV